MELNETCTGVRPGTDTPVFRSPNREAPAFFSHAGARGEALLVALAPVSSSACFKHDSFAKTGSGRP
jgi:hypothetical protein